MRPDYRRVYCALGTQHGTVTKPKGIMGRARETQNERETQHVLSVLVTRSEDLPGVWVAHCLNFDLISQGSTIREAVAGIEEAIASCVQWDLEDGVDSFEVRKRAPEEYWARVSKVMQCDPVPLSDAVDESRVEAAVVQFYLRFPANTDSELRLPPPWQIAELRSKPRGIHC